MVGGGRALGLMMSQGWSPIPVIGVLTGDSRALCSLTLAGSNSKKTLTRMQLC